MTATQTQPTAAANGYGEVIDVMRSITSESDMWRLSDVLLKRVPSGTKGLQEIVDRASTEGVLGSLSMNTLRAYRTTAATWPADKRVPNVSFSAHREAERLDGGITAQRKLLMDVAKAAGGTDKVTVKAVRDAVRVKSGKPAPKKRGGNAGAAAPTANGPSGGSSAIADLKGGGSQLIAAITAESQMSTKDLDALHSGASKVLAHVESLRMKRARAAKQASSSSAPKGAAAPKSATPAVSTKASRNRLKGL